MLAKNHPLLYLLGDYNLHLDILSTITTPFDDILIYFDLKHLFDTYT